MARIISYREAIREAIAEEMSANEKVIFLGEDIGAYGGAFGVSKGLLDQFGDARVIETPISENSFVGIAVGAAMTGFYPIVEIMFMDFITLAMDQIVNHAAKIHYMYGGQINVPLTVRVPSGAGKGYGASHSQSLESWFVNAPGLKVIAPSNPYSAKGLLKSAINDPNPVIFVENKMLYDLKQEVPEEPYYLEIGKAEKVLAGTDISLISYGRALHLSLEAAKIAKESGISVELIDLATLKPLDVDTILSSVKKTGKAVIVEEGYKTSGIGAEIAAIIAEECLEYLNGKVVRIAAEDCPIPSSIALEKAVLPSVDKIVEAIRKACFSYE
ncbi:MAG: alpha-ketoacid dehydrogenase subunit beta [Candidatus Margulisbacteria bacterium]|nr:alpha-ketoacid dehydrogenase subunit beta [Candidatus Margulisiibacteriota bacterium]MBU1617121.1 alpha-ketoacid dehydrogenase subunit beta [Candidatus Margulisiibacteriota bacterium]